MVIGSDSIFANNRYIFKNKEVIQRGFVHLGSHSSYYSSVAWLRHKQSISLCYSSMVIETYRCWCYFV